MKIPLIKRQPIENYIRLHARSRSSFQAWLSILKFADWKVPSDMVATYNNADILGKGTERVVFNIGGNNYRMICRYHFGKAKVHLFVLWIGTHAEYTRLCGEQRQYGISNY